MKVRTSIRTLLAVVTFFAYCLAALTRPNELWLMITAAIVFSLLLLSLLVMVASRHESRWFWLGFAIAGHWYIGLLFVYSVDSVNGINRSMLPTDVMLELFRDYPDWDIQQQYLNIGHLLWTAAIGFAGGTLTWCLRKRGGSG